ncbi:MAG: cellulase family glycosylhydrolase [Lachnospiraceae bacterium]
MKVSKRGFLSLCLCMTLVLMLFSGCGKQTETTENGGTTESNETTESGETEVNDITEETTGQETGDVVTDNVSEEEESGSQAAEEIYGFHVDGNRLLDANGNEFIMRGVNHAHAWYANNDAKALEGIAATGANSVRIVISDGVEYSKDSAAMVSALISKCRNLGMIAILEVHDGTGSNDPAMVEAATDFWIEVKDALIGNEAYAILNIVNEWQGSYSRDSYESTYCQAVAKLREAGICNTILIDSSGWGQNPKSIVECGQNIFAADPLGNTMFAIHMYGTAGKDAATIKKNIDSVRELGLCVCIGEFGWNHSDGDVDEDYIMQYCTETGVGYLAWSWKGNGGGVEYLDMTSDWDGENLSAEWGEKVVNGEYGIRNTSVLCTVFEQE